ncbi:hypothetical protein AVEN_265798-1 [Araneus ventricosus]|uniref:Tc1-like transposase DDE domain-containing protein n=1 Tax=Araneus ventricosus TaxID=182803 RepID=A0A4Y2RGJ1_ARAVE|nr:hypothetical protein AVEN_265798-1 [Araneus ventricosus]
MAESHVAVAFSFAITSEGVNINYDREVLNLVWNSGLRSWKKRIARFMQATVMSAEGGPRATEIGTRFWSNVLFTDKSRFSVEPENRRVIIWREIGTRNNPAFVHESARFGGVMVWAGVSINGHADQYIIRNGTLMALRYRDEVLRTIVVPYAAAIGNASILMDDNARPYRGRQVENFFFDEGIFRMEWPAYSPDVNRIEYVWDILGRRAGDRLSYPETIPQL